MNWRELKENGHTVLAGAVSGGLDSCTVTHWLTTKGFDVRCYTVDLAQPDEESLDAIAQRMEACGATAAELVDGREALAEAGLKVLQSQARYEGGYWNTTGIARPDHGAGHPAPDRRRRDRRAVPRRDRPGQRPGALSAGRQHAVARPGRLRALARPGVRRRVPGPRADGGVLRRQRPADQAAERGHLLDRRQLPRPDPRGGRPGGRGQAAGVRRAGHGRLAVGRAVDGRGGVHTLGAGRPGGPGRARDGPVQDLRGGEPRRRRARRRNRLPRGREPVRRRQVAGHLRGARHGAAGGAPTSTCCSSCSTAGPGSSSTSYRP